MISTATHIALNKIELVNTGQLATKFCLLISIHRKSTMRAFSDNFGLRSRIFSATSLRFDAKDLVNIGLLTTKFSCLILTFQLILTYFDALRLICKIMMQLRSGHVTLLRMEFQPPNSTQSDLRRQAASRWALFYISSLCLFLWPCS